MREFLLKFTGATRLWLLLMIFSLPVVMTGQTVTTDKLDYAPGEIAIISGSGWIGDTLVDIHMDEDPPLHAEHEHDFDNVPVNEDGTWSVEFPIEEYHLGVTFYVTVTGQQTGRTAETVFTDGNVRIKTSQSTAVITWNLLPSTNCSGLSEASGTGAVTTNNGSTFTKLNTNNTKSLRIEAPLLANNGSVFSSWSGSSSEFSVDPLNPRIICVPGTSPSGIQDFTINYVNCTSPSISNQPSVASITYGDTDPVFSVTAAGHGLSYQWQTRANSGAAWTNVGTDTNTYTVTKPGVSLNGSEYQVVITGSCGVVTSNVVKLTVNAKPITVTVDANQSKTYGDAEPAFTYTSAPAVGSSLDNGHSISFTGSLARASGEDVGTYAINQGSLANSNYDITFNGADFEITQLAVVVTVDANQSKTYGDAEPGFTYTSAPAVGSSLDNGHSISFTGSLARASGEDVGTYAINQGSLANSNYDITFNGADFEITQLAVTVNVDANQSKTYGDAEPAFTYTSAPAVGSSLDNGHSISFTGSLARASGEDVGTYAINQGSHANSNYDITFNGADFEITQLAVTVNVDANQSKTYGDAEPAFTYTSAPAVGSSLDNGHSISFTGSLARASGEDVGTYAINQGTLDNSNYDITFNGADFEITQLAVVVTVDADQSKTYGDAEPGFTYTSAPAVGSSLDNGHSISFTGSLARASGEDVGTYAINQGSLANSNYDITFNGADFEITQLAVVVTVDADQSKTYGDAEPAFTYTSAPAVGSSLDNGHSISFSGSLARASGEDVGLYAINQGSLANSNYDITFNGADFEITQLAVVVTVDADQSKTYGDAEPAFTYTSAPAVGSSLDNGHSISFTGSLARASGEDVGSYAINQGSLANSNYDITFNGADFEITQLAVVVTVDANQSKTYGDAEPAFTYTSAPAVGSSLDNGHSISFTGSLARASGEDVGTYAINQGDLGNDNYDITFNGADFEITQLAVVVTVDAGQSKTYGDAEPAFTYTSAPAVGSSLDNGHSISFTGSLARASGEDVGTYAINQGDLGNDNYDITFNGADFEITQLAVVVTVDADQSKTYGDAEPAFTYTSAPAVGSSLDNGHSISFTGSLARASGEDVGTYAINQGSLANSNYDITFNGADFEITQLAVVVTVDAGQSKTYGDAEPGFTYTSAPAVGSSLDNGHSISFTGSLARASGEDVGTYAINQGSLANSNYDITFNGADFEITQLAVVVTVDAGQSKTYGDAEPGFTYTSAPAVGSSLDNGHSISFSGSLARASGEDVGSYAINQGTLDNSNYDITFNGADFEITQLAVTVNVDANQSKTYGDAEPAFTYTSAPAVGSSLDNGHSISFTGSLARASGEDVGTYAINQGSLANSNYDITFNGADFEITQLAVVVTVDAGQSKTYGDAEPGFTYTSAPAVGSSLDNGHSISFTGSLARASGEDVGTYAINQGSLANSNYDITFNGADFEITQLAVVVTVDAGQSKTYGDAEPGFTYTSAPAVGSSLDNGHSISFSGSLARASGEDVGSYAINQGTLDNSNYDITFNGADFEITQLAVTVNVDANQSKTYGDAEPAFTYTSAPAVGSSLDNGHSISFTGSLARASGEDVGTYAINQGSLANSNYDIIFNGADFEITQLAVTVNVDANQSKTYGDAEPAFTYTSAPAVGSSLDNGHSISFTGSLARASGEDVGTYAINQGDLGNDNYDITFNGADFEITQLAVVVTVDAGQSKTYGDAEPAFTYTSAPAVGSSLDNGDAISFNGSLARASGEDVAFYAINQGSLANSNYDITFNGDDFEITQLAVTVTVDANQSKTYGDAEPVFTYTSAPAVGDVLANGDAISFTGSLARASGEDVGSYAINQGSLANDNYDITFNGDDFEITSRSLVLSNFVADDKTYDGNTSVTGDGFDDDRVTGDALTFTYDVAFADKNVADDKNVNFTNIAISGGADQNNYNLSTTSGIATADITLASLNITANNATKHEGQVNPTFSVTYSGFVNGENNGVLGGTLVFSTDADVNSCADDYDINPSGLTSGNYNITFNKGTLTVTGVTIDASASSNPVQVGTTATLSAQVTPAVGGVSVTFTLSEYNMTNSGSFNTTYTALTNATGKATVSVSNLPTDVYKVTAVVGGGCSESEAYLPVYDPNGGFVTGGGWISSEPGNMEGNKSGAYGKANFGFNAKYKNGKNNMNEVDGNTNFQFQAGDLHLKSKSHDDMSLVISGAKATYRGIGTVNGKGNHKFLIIAIDGDISGGGGQDKFRIKIWDDNSSSVLYDNQRLADENSNDATILGGGSIVIHKPKGGNQKGQQETAVAENFEPVIEILSSMSIAPNPVRTEALIRFSFNADASAMVEVFDFGNRKVANLFNGKVTANQVNELTFSRDGIPSGSYFVKVTASNGQTFTKQIIVD
jgi:large repetitive protein